MHCPATVSRPMPMAWPGITATRSSIWVMAWAAMAAVPRVETVDCTTSLPSWNMEFSTPVGIPTFSTMPIMARLGRIFR